MSDPNNASSRGTRERILEAALDTIYKEKINGASIRLIAENADISKGHLNYYFATRQELLSSLLFYLFAKFLEDREPTLSDDAIPTLQKFDIFYEQKSRFVHERKFPYVLYDFWVQSTVDDDLAETLKHSYCNWRADVNRVIDEGYEKGIFNGANREMMAPFVVAILEGAGIQYLIDPEAFDLDTFFNFAREVLEKVLIGNSGIEGGAPSSGE